MEASVMTTAWPCTAQMAYCQAHVPWFAKGSAVQHHASSSGFMRRCACQEESSRFTSGVSQVVVCILKYPKQSRLVEVCRDRIELLKFLTVHTSAVQF